MKDEFNRFLTEVYGVDHDELSPSVLEQLDQAFNDMVDQTFSSHLAQTRRDEIK